MSAPTTSKPSSSIAPHSHASVPSRTGIPLSASPAARRVPSFPGRDSDTTTRNHAPAAKWSSIAPWTVLDAEYV